MKVLDHGALGVGEFNSSHTTGPGEDVPVVNWVRHSLVMA